MKKDKLIEMLNKIEGNPDILLWNGLVADWMDIESKPIEQILTKETVNHYLDAVRWERCRDTKNIDYQLTEEELVSAKRNSKELAWELNEFITEDDIKTKRHKSKTVFFLNAKTRGETFFDRAGTVKY